MSRMTVGSPLPFEVEKKALRPSGSKSLFRGKAPSIIRPSYSVHNSMYSFQSVGIGGQGRKPRRANQTGSRWSDPRALLRVLVVQSLLSFIGAEVSKPPQESIPF